MTTRSPFPADIEPALRAAGWFAGRRVDVSGWVQVIDRPGGFEIFSAAREALEEFGGLKIHEQAPGKDYRDYPGRSLELDPTLGQGEEDYFEGYRAELDSQRLYPLQRLVKSLSH